MEPSLSFETRQANLKWLAAESVDLLVIGGGITGAGIARDAAMRGISTALIDKSDFGSGTSSISSRLVHGGLRYLEHRHWRLVFEASHERRVLLRIAPHLVWPRSFIFPIHEGCRVNRWTLAAGLWLYDLLAAFRNVRRHQMLGKRGIRRAEPLIRERGLQGGARYYDAQCDDARLTLANVRDAHRHGAKVSNYAAVERLELADGVVRGAHVVDLVSGDEFSIRAHVVVNATGPWTDQVAGVDPPATLHTTKGAHVLVPRSRIGNHEAVTMISPIDERVLFAVPWGDFTYLGTTETETDGSPDEIVVTAEDVVYLLRTANAFFPEARLTPADVVATWAGVRPLLKAGDDPNKASREHRIWADERGLLTIAGGKLTTYRRMAAQMADQVAARLHHIDGRPIPPRARTDRHPLPGGETGELEILIAAAENEGLSHDTAAHYVRTHGSETPAVVRLAQSNLRWTKPVVENLPTTWAQLIYAMRREMALTLGDLLVRRSHIFYEAPDHGLGNLAEIVDVAAEEMGWDEDRQRAEVAAYHEFVRRNEAFREELDESALD